MHPLTSININLLNVLGRSDLYMKLQLVMQSLSIPVMIAGIFYGIKIMILGSCLNYLLSYLLFCKISSRFSGYEFNRQLKDVLHLLPLGIIMGAAVFSVDYLTSFSPLITLVIQLSAGVMIVLLSGELFKIKEYIFLRDIVLNQIKSTVNRLALNSRG